MKTKEVFNKQSIKGAMKEYKALGITMSIILIIVGLLMMIFPAISSLAFYIAFCVGLLLSGIFNIIRYAKDKSVLRQPWLLINGIVNILLGVMLSLSLALEAAAYSNATGDAFYAGLLYQVTSLFYWVMLFYAFSSLFKGIFRLTNLRYHSDTLKWYEITSGIIQIVVGASLIIFSFVGTLVDYQVILIILMTFLGFYVVLRGIMLLIDIIINSKEKDKVRIKKTPTDEKDVIDAEIIDKDNMN